MFAKKSLATLALSTVVAATVLTGASNSKWYIDPVNNMNPSCAAFWAMFSRDAFDASIGQYKKGVDQALWLQFPKEQLSDPGFCGIG